MQGSKGAVNREECQACGCVKMINNHYLREGDRDRVFVECSECGALVARYIIDTCTDPELSYRRLVERVGSEGDNCDLKAKADRIGGKTEFEQEEEEPPPQIYFRSDIIKDG